MVACDCEGLQSHDIRFDLVVCDMMRDARTPLEPSTSKCAGAEREASPRARRHCERHRCEPRPPSRRRRLVQRDPSVHPSRFELAAAGRRTSDVGFERVKCLSYSRGAVACCMHGIRLYLCVCVSHIKKTNEKNGFGSPYTVVSVTDFVVFARAVSGVPVRSRRLAEPLGSHVAASLACRRRGAGAAQPAPRRWRGAQPLERSVELEGCSRARCACGCGGESFVLRTPRDMTYGRCDKCDVRYCYSSDQSCFGTCVAVARWGVFVRRVLLTY